MDKFSENIDWLKATNKERKAQYTVIRAISLKTEQTVEELVELALGQPTQMASSYSSTMRRGSMARLKAKEVHAWIAEHHMEIARTIAPELFPEDTYEAWEQFLDQHAITGKLRIVRLKSDLGIVQRVDRILPVEQSLSLGDEFCLELESDTAGIAIAFQGYKGTWHALPLGVNGDEHHAKISAGKQLLPAHPDGRPIAFAEYEDRGLHSFAIIVLPEHLTYLLDKLSTNYLPANPVKDAQIYRLCVLVRQ